MKPYTINHIIPWSEIALLSSSKKQWVHRGFGSRIIHKQSPDSRAIKLESMIDRIVISNLLCSERDNIWTSSIVTYFVPYNRNVVYSQILCIHSYLSNSLGCISVKEDCGSWHSPLFVYLLNPQTNVFNWLLKKKYFNWQFMLNPSKKTVSVFTKHLMAKSSSKHPDLGETLKIMGVSVLILRLLKFLC